MIGSRIGPYEIVSAIGAGGMGEVFRARDTKLNRDVAIKVLPTEFASDHERVARFRREAQILASLNHPNIGAIYGLEEDPSRSTIALAMEFVEGEDIAKRLSRGAIPLDEALPIAKQIAEALEDAHEHGIIHRDLKPGNVKVTPDGKVKVLDFGLAKAMEGAAGSGSGAGSDSQLSHSPTMSRHATEAGIILGTAAYMSPEQARGKSVDKRADIWSFGVVLFEMLTGRRLFSGETVSDTLAAVLRAEIDWTALPKDAPPALAKLLRRCLDRDPQNRLRDVGDARLELSESLSSGPAAALSAGKAKRGPVWPLAMAGLLALAALGVWSARGPAARPVYEAAYLTTSGHDRSPAASPDGKSVAFVSDRDGRSRIWIRQFATGAELPLSEGPMDDGPRFAPDGSAVLFTRYSGGKPALYRVPSLGGEARRVLDDGQNGSYSADGKRIAFLRSEPLVPGRPLSNSLHIANSDGTSATLVKRYEESRAYASRLSPDGRWIAVFVGNSAGNFSIRVVSADGSSDRVLAAPNNAWMSGATATWDSNRRILTAGGDLAGSTANAAGGRIQAIDLDSGKVSLVYSHPDALPDVDLLPDGALVSSVQTVRQNIALWTGSAGRRLTHGRSVDRQPAFSPDGKTIVFSSDRSGNLDLWSLSVETGALRQITDDAAVDFDPAFAPDGRLLFASNRSGVFEVWTAESDGSAARQLTHDGVDAENPAFSKDGAWLFYGSSRPKQAGVWKARADGSNAALLIPGAGGIPEISPDGRYVMHLLFQDYGDTLIRVSRLADGTPTSFRIEVRLARLSTLALGRARWMPDGKIAFIGQDERGANGVFVQDFSPDRDTTATRRKLGGFDPEIDAETFGISPDGKSIAVAGREIVSNLMLLRRPVR